MQTNPENDTQRIFDNHGNLTQNGHIYDFSKAKIYNTNNYIFDNLNYKKLDQFIISIDISPILKIINLDNLFKIIEYFIYTNNYSLELSVNKPDNISLSIKYIRTENILIENMKNFIYSEKKEYNKNKTTQLSYSKFIAFINNLNKNLEYEFISTGATDDIEIIKKYFFKNLVRLENVNSNDFFNFLLKNNVEFITPDFLPKNIIDYIKYKINFSEDYIYPSSEEWKDLFDELKNFDLRIMIHFLFQQNKYKINISSLEKFCVHNNLNTSFYKEIRGRKPYCLSDICIKKYNEDYCEFSNYHVWNILEEECYKYEF